jgi:transposase
LARPADEKAQFRVKPHTTGSYTYASTQPPYVDPETGKKKYRYVHWGSVDEDLKFTPGTQFYLASPEERSRLIFPEGWDISEAEKFTGLRKPGRPAYGLEDMNRLYGDIWLLEQIAERTGIRQDLENVFNGNIELVNDIITLAVFPYITNYTYNRVARWQNIARAPSLRPLTSPEITRLTQSITERHRMALLKLRAARLGKDELCAVDSTTRSAYGRSLADIHWGKNKDRLPLEQTTEVVVYTLSSHMPVYYRTFPGNMPDVRSLDTILVDLEHGGFKDLVLVTDRGYESLRNLEKYILRGQSMVMCVKTGRSDVLAAILGFGDFGARPDGMAIDADAKIYHKQYDLDYEVKSTGASAKKADRLKLNLYFDPMRRSAELVELDITLSFQQESLEELQRDKGAFADASSVKRDYCYYNVNYDPATMVVKSFELNEKKVEKTKRLSGFFAIMTHGVDFSAMEAFHTYSLRDEQEKYFQQMKSQVAADRQRNWSEEGKTGRLFILFVSLILSSWVRHIWKTTELYELFSSSLEILDEMRPVRMIEHTNRAKVVTSFVGKQVDICEAFGFAIPDGCAPSYTSRQKPKRKRGRPPKPRTEKGL